VRAIDFRHRNTHPLAAGVTVWERGANGMLPDCETTLADIDK